MGAGFVAVDTHIENPGAGADRTINIGDDFDASRDEIKESLDGAAVVFVVCGEGGSTGSAVAPAIAEIAKEVEALTVGVVSKPFEFEGHTRISIAEEGIATLQAEVDTLIVIPNERLLQMLERRTTMVAAFREADEVLGQAVQWRCASTHPGQYSLGVADVASALGDQGLASMGTARGTGPNRAVDAARAAITSPLIVEDIEKAKSLLIQVAGGPELMMYEIVEAAEMISSMTDPGANVIFGSTVDDSADDEVRVSVIATFGGSSAPSS